jgi:hypothetical protein
MLCLLNSFVSENNRARSVNMDIFYLFRKFECSVKIICSFYKATNVVQKEILFVILWVMLW